MKRGSKLVSSIVKTEKEKEKNSGKRRKSTEQVLQLSVTGLSGSCVKVSANASDTVRKFKEAIERQYGTPTYLQILSQQQQDGLTELCDDLKVLTVCEFYNVLSTAMHERSCSRIMASVMEINFF
jgi:hypothetical protein